MSARSNANAPHNQTFNGPNRPNTKARAWYKLGNSNNKKSGKKNDE